MQGFEVHTDAFRSLLANQNLTIFSEQPIGYGYQITVTDGANRIPVSFYNTGRIVVQGKDSVLKAQLKEWANLRQAGVDQIPQVTHSVITSSPISRNSRYTVGHAKFSAIREDVINHVHATIIDKPVTQSAEVYRSELQRGSERVTVTQFQTGTLFVQGRSSVLFDEVCELLDRRLMQSFADRAASYLPEDAAISTRQFLETPEAQNDAWIWVQKELGQDVLNFLRPNDQQTLVSGAGILLALQETKRQLAEFSPVVMPFGKAFEGFVTQLSIFLGLVTQEAIQQSAENISIGKWIGDIRERVPDQRRYDFVAASLNNAWQSRNKAMHADPQEPRTIRALDEAKQEIAAIIVGMKKVHDVFLVQQVPLRPKNTVGINSVTASTKSPTKTTGNANSNITTPNINVPVKARFDNVDIQLLAKHLEADGYKLIYKEASSSNAWELQEEQFKVFCLRKAGGRVTIVGPGAEQFTTQYLSILQTNAGKSPPSESDELFPDLPSKNQSGWIGVDESGKGDVFGPLVIAGVYTTNEQASTLARLGVRDSKTLGESAILRLSAEIQAICPNHTLLIVEPLEYNLLYEKLQNLNVLLAQKHAEAISTLSTITSATHAISDQFGDESLVRLALRKHDCTIDLRQRPHAEDDIAVAAASILARSAVVNWFQRVSQTVGYTLPFGVASSTVEAGQRLIASQGRKELIRYAKLHFRTVREML